jgi:hypothetical protein
LLLVDDVQRGGAAEAAVNVTKMAVIAAKATGRDRRRRPLTAAGTLSVGTTVDIDMLAPVAPLLVNRQVCLPP